MKKEIKKLASMAIILLLLLGCSNDDNTGGNSDQSLKITSLSPDNGGKGDVIKIMGNGFGTDEALVKVFFNDKEALVSNLTNTEIEVAIPPKAFTGPVKITVNGEELEGPEFTYNITSTVVTTIAGSGIAGDEDAQNPLQAKFKAPYDIIYAEVNQNKHFYLVDLANHKIKRIGTAGIVTTIGGSTMGYMNGQYNQAKFYEPRNIVSVQDNGTSIFYISDTKNHVIRKLTGGEVTTYAGNGTAGFADGDATTAQFNEPQGLTIDDNGNLYVCDGENHKIRKISPSGQVTTVAGSTQGFFDGVALSAQFNFPMGIAIDPEKNLFVADGFNNKIRKITPNGVVSTFAGSDQGDQDGIGNQAKFYSPFAITIDKWNHLYVSDIDNHKIKKITPAGHVTTLAGSTEGDSNGEGLLEAKFAFPRGLCVDELGDIYVADIVNNKIKKIVQE
ncbi:SMP-30/gluconolactonase/LRE family protein [Aquimarina algiphila]|uniref:SMP-30/gluconolactonase/LRE family protein n=1 Tax=Aquimarina algiphila TaxID=2047982 RepID=UPI00232ABE2F|nr:SMP-30/gluconolactonase/LRE family protein [Aquimarina algiphila]